MGFSVTCEAETKFDPTSCVREHSCFAYLNGRITSKDLAVFQTIDKQIATLPEIKQRIVVILNSDGGDVEAAIGIGRILRRQTYSDVRLLKYSRCLSACVFVLAGGLLRLVDGQVGIHRPYTDGLEVMTYRQNQERFSLLENLAKNFLKDMNLPPALYDQMMRIPPEKMQILSATELTQFGLNQHDPVYMDTLDSQQARRHGLRKQEYLARREVAHRICNSSRSDSTGDYLLDKQIDSAAVSKCYEEIMKATREQFQK
jgi:ATP-dependent protease ClpP protease subunit